MRKLGPLFSLLLLLPLVPAIAAQTSPAVERGTVTFTGSSLNPQGRFTFTGPHLFVLTGGLIDGNFSPASPITGGQEIHIRSVFSGSLSIRPGDMSTGTETRFVFYDGNLTFDSAPLTLPIRYSRSTLNIVVPITVQGNIDVHRTDPFNNPNLLFQTAVNLQGTATLRLRTIYVDYFGLPVYQFLGLTYDFPLANNPGKNGQ